MPRAPDGNYAKRQAREAKSTTPTLVNCPTCRQSFVSRSIRTRKCDACRAQEEAEARALSGSYTPLARGPLPESDAGPTEPRAGTGNRGGHPGGGGSPYELLFVVFPLYDRFSVQTETQADGLRWFAEQRGPQIIAGPYQGSGRRFDTDVDEESVYRLAHTLGRSLRGDPRGLLVRDSVQVQYHAGGTHLDVLAASVRIHGEILGGLHGADFGCDASGLICQLSARLGANAANEEGQS
ncbi:hypothetical protein [Cupriavidus sp. DL-D2]|uniref:hypothetical protein n=1 Tax=Cupriavidus sp. DL-D2 TaxID=3144974 RepID=UPI0032126728